MCCDEMCFCVSLSLYFLHDVLKTNKHPPICKYQKMYCFSVIVLIVNDDDFLTHTIFERNTNTVI